MTGTTVKNVTKKVMDKSGNTVKTVTGSDDGKSIFFLILAFGCMYLILDVFYGNNKLKSLADTIFGVSDSGGSLNGDGTTEDTHSGLFGSSDFLLPKSDKQKLKEMYGKADKATQEAYDKHYEDLLKKGYENLPKGIQEEIDIWRENKEKYNPDATDGFGGGGGSH